MMHTWCFCSYIITYDTKTVRLRGRELVGAICGRDAWHLLQGSWKRSWKLVVDYWLSVVMVMQTFWCETVFRTAHLLGNRNLKGTAAGSWRSRWASGGRHVGNRAMTRHPRPELWTRVIWRWSSRLWSRCPRCFFELSPVWDMISRL